MVDGIPTFLENIPEDYRGYYSRVVLDGGWDEAWESSNGVSGHQRESLQKKEL